MALVAVWILKIWHLQRAQGSSRARAAHQDIKLPLKRNCSLVLCAPMALFFAHAFLSIFYHVCCPSFRPSCKITHLRCVQTTMQAPLLLGQHLLPLPCGLSVKSGSHLRDSICLRCDLARERARAISNQDRMRKQRKEVSILILIVHEVTRVSAPPGGL